MDRGAYNQANEMGPHHALIAGVFRQAIADQDWRWFASDSAEAWADMGGLDIEHVREMARAAIDASQSQEASDMEATLNHVDMVYDITEKEAASIIGVTLKGVRITAGLGKISYQEGPGGVRTYSRAECEAYAQTRAKTGGTNLTRVAKQEVELNDVAKHLVATFESHTVYNNRNKHEYPYLVLCTRENKNSRHVLKTFPGTSLKPGQSLQAWVESVAPGPGSYEAELRLGGKDTKRMTRKVIVEAKQ